MDMTDNAAKMGTPIESVQQAYQGFAKGQYQLLDNLKLGYGGTKTEMERLLKDAQEISGVE
jgi:phage-related protein